MKKLAFVFILGLVAGSIGHWYYTERFKQEDLKAAGQKILQGAGQVKDAIAEKVGEIPTDEIRQELARTGMIVRDKARKAGATLADTATDARITAEIKAKLFKEPGLSSLKVHVETSDGLVTVSGTVSYHEEIAKVVRLALETEGVQRVVSTLQVKPGT